MNTYKKYCPNVFVSQCEEKHEKGETITDIKPEDVVLKIGDEVKKVTKFKYNPFHGGYDFEWE